MADTTPGDEVAVEIEAVRENVAFTTISATEQRTRLVIGTKSLRSLAPAITLAAAAQNGFLRSVSVSRVAPSWTACLTAAWSVMRTLHPDPPVEGDIGPTGNRPVLFVALYLCFQERCDCHLAGSIESSPP